MLFVVTIWSMEAQSAPLTVSGSPSAKDAWDSPMAPTYSLQPNTRKLYAMNGRTNARRILDLE